MFIPITELKRFKRFATALFGHGLVKRTTMIHLYPQSDSCTIEASSQGRTLSLEVGFEPDSRERNESVTLAPETLDQICLGEGEAYFSEVASTENGSRFTISWQQGVVRKTVELDYNSPDPRMTYEYQPVRIDDRFLGCLHQCVQLTDDDAVQRIDRRDGTIIIDITSIKRIKKIKGHQPPIFQTLATQRTDKLRPTQGAVFTRLVMSDHG